MQISSADCILIVILLLILVDLLVYFLSDDILMAVRKLKALGNGFMVIPIGNGKHLVQSVPGELTMDHTTLLQQAEVIYNIIKLFLYFNLVIKIMLYSIHIFYIRLNYVDLGHDSLARQLFFYNRQFIAQVGY